LADSNIICEALEEAEQEVIKAAQIVKELEEDCGCDIVPPPKPPKKKNKKS